VVLRDMPYRKPTFGCSGRMMKPWMASQGDSRNDSSRLADGLTQAMLR
jgi:hypothetical protein